MKIRRTSLAILAMILAGAGIQAKTEGMNESTAKKVLSVIVPPELHSDLEEITKQGDSSSNDEKAAKLIEETSKRLKRSVCSQFP